MPHIGRSLLLACLLGTAPLDAVAGAAEPFRIGIVGRDDSGARVPGLSTIETAFRRALGREIEIYVAQDFARLVDAHIGGRIDYAVYTTQAFAAAQLRCGCLRPLAAPVASDGSVGIRSLLRSRPGVAAPRLAVGAPDSLATRLVPLALSEAAKAAQADGLLVDAGTAGTARALFENGEVDGYFAWEPVRPADGFARRDSSVEASAAQEAEGSWHSQTIPFGPHAVRADLDEDLAGTVLAALNGAPWETESAGALLDPRSSGRFIGVTLDDYRAAIAAVALLGKDPVDGD